jgi:putative FmdB family regulatory protein
VPTYEYECKKCGHRFDEFQSIKDEPIKKCPECKAAVKRLIGPGAGIIFKGKGFYQTDYKSLAGGDKKTDPKGAKTPPCGKSDSCDSCKG